MAPARPARADDLSARRARQVDEPGHFQFSVALRGDGARGCGAAARTAALPDGAAFVGPSRSIDDCALLVEEAADIPGAPPEVAEFAGTIRDAAGRALRLVTDLLDLSRLETGALDLARQPVDLVTLARAVAARYVDALAARGITLTVAAPADALMVEADPSRLEQVVDQLLSNAARFTPAGSVAVSLAATGDRVRLEVRDTGVGIADDVLEAVFEPFVQEDARVNRDYGGTGLGLAIASRLALQMGGDLSAASVKGEGSTFTLALPRA